jgi:adsorption protein A
MQTVRAQTKVLGWAALLFLSLVAWGVQPGRAEEKDADAAVAAYRRQLQVQRQEGWLQRHLRTFRTYPHLDRANKLMAAGRLQEARQELEKSLAIDPQDLQARYTYLIVLTKLGDYPAVEQQADLILEQKPDFAPARLYRGLARQKAGQILPAREDFRAVAANPQAAAADRRFATRMAASLALEQQDYAGALAALDALDPGSQDFASQLSRGFALEGLGRLPEAAEAFRQAQAAASSPAEKRQAWLALAENARKRDDLPAAQRAYEEALAITPKDAAIMRELARLANVRKDYAGAAAWLQRAQQTSPEAGDQEFLVNVLAAKKDYQPAIAALQQQLLETTDPQERYQLLVKMGHLYLEWGKPAQAVGAFREALRLKPDAATRRLLGFTLEKMGELSEAYQIFREIAAQEPSGENYFALAELANRLDRDEEALHYYGLAVRQQLPTAQKLAAYKQMGFLAARRHDYNRARRAWEQALQLSPRDMGLYASLADAAAKTGDLSAALHYQERLVELSGSSGAPSGEHLENLGYLNMKLNRPEAAIASFLRAIAAGRDSAALRLNLGYLYLKLNDRPAALENFRVALKMAPQPGTYLAIGRLYKELRQPGVAIFYLLKARAFAESLPRVDQIDLFSTLGYLYAETGQYIPAALAFSQSLRLQYDPVIALRLARMERLVGHPDQALALLAKLPVTSLPPDLHAAYYEEQGAALQEENDLPAAIEAYEQAKARSDQADHYYRIGLMQRRLNQLDAAIASLREAHSREPQDNNYATALGYAYLKAKKYTEAGYLFEEVLARDPDYLKLYEDLGYIHLKNKNNDRAVYWFKRAIDNRPLYPVASAAEAIKLDNDMYAFRKEITKMTNRYDLTFYLGYRSSKAQQFNAPGGLLGGSILADNGVEFAYQPPVIGFRDERMFQAFVRVLWGNEPASLRVDGDTFQGGAGLRYKPLKTQNLWLSGERLFRLGRKSTNDWLFRLLYSWDDGYDLQYNKSCWNYTFLYSEGDYFARGIWVYYGEARQGMTFNCGNKFLVTPHLIVNLRYQDPCQAASSYLEGGGGVSLKYLYNETKYEINRSSVELLVHYKFGNFMTQGFSVNGTGYNGVNVLLVNRFF